MVMAGGTGGHVFPALAVASRLRELGAEVFWLGTRRGMEARLVPEQGIPMEWMTVEGLRGAGVIRWLKAPAVLALALLQAGRVIRRRRPAVALGMGGFASGPGGVAARMLGVPLVVHEQNKIPGFTNQWLARMAIRVFEAFPSSFPRRHGAVTCGNPVRREIGALPPPEERFAGRTGPLRVLVLGGSQGARILNEVVPEALAEIEPDVRPLVRHQAGSRTIDGAKEAYRRAGVQADIAPFIRDMADAYGWADLVIARAGALTLSELAAAGLGGILVPFPHAVDDHQTKNAAYLVEAGAAVLMPQAELNPETLCAGLRRYAQDRGRALELARAARRLGRVDADAVVARACLEVARS
jgi:UDP-N-acetylglucosamine--N-acetylmuramyl-(pentapeptide) pyrophosphoryl-undecaprenol N-acetylglucosamine transferase